MDKFLKLCKGCSLLIPSIISITVFFLVIISATESVNLSRSVEIKLNMGLSLIGIAVTVWVGLNIYNLIEKKQLELLENKVVELENGVLTAKHSLSNVEKELKIKTDLLQKIIDEGQEKGQHIISYLDRSFYINKIESLLNEEKNETMHLYYTISEAIYYYKLSVVPEFEIGINSKSISIKQIGTLLSAVVKLCASYKKIEESLLLTNEELENVESIINNDISYWFYELDYFISEYIREDPFLSTVDSWEYSILMSSIDESLIQPLINLKKNLQENESYVELFKESIEGVEGKIKQLMELTVPYRGWPPEGEN